MTPDEVIAKFDIRREASKTQFQAICPAHEDRQASLCIGIKGPLTLIKCQAGCDSEDIVAAVGLKMSDLMGPSKASKDANGNGAKSKIDATYDYVDADGRIVYQAVRMVPKDFRQRRPDGNGGWHWSVKGVDHVPYRLPELLRSDATVFIVEGEKDVDRLATAGIVATCNVGGAGKWRDEYNQHFAGRDVVVLPDNDDAGRKHAKSVADSLVGTAATVRIVELPGLADKGDVSDWIDGLSDAADPLELLLELAAACESQGSNLPAITAIGELVTEYPRLRRPVMHGLLRIGETANLIAASKVGKSWLSYGMALAVATGEDWLETFRCEAGKVLIIDNELHRETISDRLPHVAREMGIDWKELAGQIDVVSLRGFELDLLGLTHYVNAIERGTYQLVIADAWYRFIPPGISENDNAQIMSLYNRVDRYTAQLDCGWVNIHHASKGPQDAKTVVDVGAGAGSQSRAADTHIVLRPHEDDGVAVLEAAVRSWPPVKPLAVRWNYPLWHSDPTINPAKLRRPLTAKQRQQQAEDEATVKKIIASFLGDKVQTAGSLRRTLGIGKDRLERLLDKLQADGQITRKEVTKRGNVCGEYRLAPPEQRENRQEDRQNELLAVQ